VRGWLWFLLVVALVGGGIYYYERHQEQLAIEEAQKKAAEAKAKGKGGGATPVVAIPARKGRINVYLDGLGTVTPLRTVTVKSRVEGQLMRVHFREGEMVERGQLLAEIDPRPFQVQLKQAEGQLARDQALLAHARLDVERYRTLLAQDSIARQQVDAQEALVRQYEGIVKSDQSQVENARLQLSYARVTAPISGRVGLRLVDPGNIVRAGDATGLVVITQLAPVGVLFTVPQDNLPRLMKRMQEEERLMVEAWDRDQKSLLARGRLLAVDNLVDVATGTVKLKAAFRNEENELFPNQFVNVRLRLETLEDQTVIQQGAVQRGGQGLFVYVVKEDMTVTARPVVLGPVDGTRVAVVKGVAPGERVVIDGIDRLREGTRVVLAKRPDFTPSVDGTSGARKGKGKGKGKGKPAADAPAAPDAAKGNAAAAPAGAPAAAEPDAPRRKGRPVDAESSGAGAPAKAAGGAKSSGGDPEKKPRARKPPVDDEYSSHPGSYVPGAEAGAPSEPEKKARRRKPPAEDAGSPGAAPSGEPQKQGRRPPPAPDAAASSPAP
jgi:multidrug efflux system membrane fusion protein